MKHAGGNTAERCSPSKNNTGAALGKAAVVQARLRLESGKACGGWALSLYITESLSETFQEMVCFGRRESLGFFFFFFFLIYNLSSN